MISEEFLHFVWKYKNFNHSNLFTSGGQPVRIIKAGEHNSNAGPDFLNAQVMIGETRWAGNVEIHIKSSDWMAHGHQHDKAYDNVILHVVYENDMHLNGNADVPVLELSSYISPGTVSSYSNLKETDLMIPCQPFFHDIDDFILHNWLDRLLVERLEARSERIAKVLEQTGNDWQEAAYRIVGRNFGFKVNNEPFELLTRSLPNKLFGKHKNSLMQIEALLFGQAGFLEDDFVEPYPLELQKEYRFLAKKYELRPGQKENWKFLRLRPGNFPTFRLSQFAALLYQSEHLFSKMLEVKTIKEALTLFEVAASEYWNDHHLLETLSSSASPKKLGDESRQNIVVNSVAPILFAYGHLRKQPKYKDLALNLLENSKAEQNKITKQWAELGVNNGNAYDSQALIHLKTEYCDAKRCLSCGIGTHILSQRSN